MSSTEGASESESWGSSIKNVFSRLFIDVEGNSNRKPGWFRKKLFEDSRSLRPEDVKYAMKDFQKRNPDIKEHPIKYMQEHNIRYPRKISKVYPKYNGYAGYSGLIKHYKLQAPNCTKRLSDDQKTGLYHHILDDLFNVRARDAWLELEKCEKWCIQENITDEAVQCHNPMSAVRFNRFKTFKRVQDLCNLNVQKLQYDIYEGKADWKDSLENLVTCVNKDKKQ